MTETRYDSTTFKSGPNVFGKLLIGWLHTDLIGERESPVEDLLVSETMS